MHTSTSSSGLKRQILAAIRRRPSPARPVMLVQTVWLVLAMVAMELGLFVACGGACWGKRPIAYLLFTGVVWAIAALVAVWIAFGRGGSMLGRPRRWLLAICVLLPLALFGWMLLAAMVFPGTLASNAEARHGCSALTLTLAIWPVTVYALFWPESVRSPGMTGAARATAVGACVGVLTLLWCPNGKLVHLGLSHVLPLLVLSVYGCALGKRLSRVYRRPSAAAH